MMDHKDNSFGVAGVILGILSLCLVIIPMVGLALGIIGVIFAYKQKKRGANSWSKAGLWLSWIGVVIGAFWSIYYIKTMIEVAKIYKEQLATYQANGNTGLSSYGTK